MPTTIAIDAMSGDRGPRVAVGAMKAAVNADPDLDLIAVGKKETLVPLVEGTDRISILDAKEMVSMSDEPLKVLRRRESSMFKTVKAVADGDAQAGVSPGNTGALIGMGRILLKMIEGHSRPAIGSFVPCQKCSSSFCMLDLGANIDRSTEMLVAFAYLGDALHRAVTGSKNPSVGLLNIGKEHIKGDRQIIEAGDILASSGLNFIGNVEANVIYEKVADVVGLRRLHRQCLPKDDGGGFKHDQGHAGRCLFARPAGKDWCHRIDAGAKGSQGGHGYQEIQWRCHPGLAGAIGQKPRQCRRGCVLERD